MVSLFTGIGGIDLGLKQVCPTSPAIALAVLGWAATPTNDFACVRSTQMSVNSDMAYGLCSSRGNCIV